jgi:hypothetical protein
MSTTSSLPFGGFYIPDFTGKAEKPERQRRVFIAFRRFLHSRLPLCKGLEQKGSRVE